MRGGGGGGGGFRVKVLGRIRFRVLDFKASGMRGVSFSLSPEAVPESTRFGQTP